MPVEGPQYPVNLVLAGRRCLVVGGGTVALAKVRGLLAGGATSVHVVAPVLRPELADLPGVTTEARPYRPGEVAGYRLVVTATDDPDVNRQVFLDGEATGTWVNSADDPANCSFTLPSVVRRGPIMVTAGTGGHSPALATWLRRHVEGQLDDAWVALAELLAERRGELRAAGVPTEGLSWQEALDSGMLEVVRAGRLDEARQLLRAIVAPPAGGPSDVGDEGRCT
jgi:precorrin-2 dehydrogenase/sirohydrochlorin ferrochelatase